MLKYFQIRKQGLQGIDVNLEISLKEYGIAWKTMPVKDITRFYIGTQLCDDGYVSFEVLDIENSIDIALEYNWCNFDDISEFTGLTTDAWLSLPITQQIPDMITYYGFENF